MKQMKIIIGASAFALMMATNGALAQTQPNDPPRMPVTQSNVDQKAKFVTNLVTASASARAIEQSGDQEALGALAAARKLVDDANKALSSGNPQEADVMLNRALSMVMAHTRRITESSVKGGRAQQLYENRLASVKALLEAFDRVAKEKNATGRTSERREAIHNILGETEALAKSGNYDGAIVQLDRAYTRITNEITALRDGDKLTKELKFASAEEEYIYEIDRNDSHVFLLKLTLNEKQQHPTYAGQIEAMRVEAETLRKDAEAKAKAKEFAPAIKILGESTDKLIRALRMAGAYIPG